MMRPGIEPKSAGPLANTLLTRPMNRNDISCAEKRNLLILYCTATTKRNYLLLLLGSPPSIMGKVLNCSLEVSQFEQ